MRDKLHEFVISGLVKRKGQWPEIAKQTGISTRTFTRMVNGENNNRRDTIVLLAEHFEANPVSATRQ